ncbi:MarR family winged helix-turn-helix transcriptional regulator [Chitinophaga flava]|uniref:MarR family transcriptional regulator n=1 Tax=Chitinophaga flava TaxID=2259036 RepID=A0A365XUI7_9BACT|nr:MarR family transcriptional regulator [Chitinophaga flava]RBL89364.1 MarR family transcriptional regulator [Chitinophaga flava]
MNTLATASSLRTCISHLTKRLRKQVYSTGELSFSEMTVMSHVYHQGPLFPSELAELVKVKNQSMSQMLNNLEAETLIVRTPSEDDKRKVLVSITAKGKKMVDKSRSERDEWLATAINNTLTEKEKKMLAEALPLLSKIADYK